LVANVAAELQRGGIPLTNGGIRYSGDVAKAMAAWASSVMVGSKFGGTEEAPGEVEFYKGRSYTS
jgi:IMP dehydrogenase